MNKKELTVTDIHTLLCLYKITFMTSIESSTTDVWCFDDFDIATILRYLFENLCHVFVCRGSQHVFVCRGCQLCLFLRFFNWIVELFRQCGIFVLFLELFRQCGITCFRLSNCSDSVVYFVLDFGTVPTVWYILFQILELFRQCGIFCFRFWNCSDSVVYFVLDVRTVPTVWYILL